MGTAAAALGPPSLRRSARGIGEVHRFGHLRSCRGAALHERDIDPLLCGVIECDLLHKMM